MIDQERLEQSLAQLLSNDLKHWAPQITTALLELFNASQQSQIPQTIKHLFLNYEFNKALSSLAGKSVHSVNSLIKIDEGSQFGDVSIKNIAGGDVINFEVNLVSQFTQQVDAQLSYYLRIADSLTSAGKPENAIEVLSNAVKSFPDEKLFLARGKAFRALAHKTHLLNVSFEVMDAYNKAIEDYSNAVAIAQYNNFIVEKKARYERLSIMLWSKVESLSELVEEVPPWLVEVHDIGREDIQWLLLNTTHAEHCEILCLKLEYEFYSRPSFFVEEAAEVRSILATVAELGFENPTIRFFQALSLYFDHNYGMAMNTLEAIIDASSRIKHKIESLQFAILLKTSNFVDALAIGNKINFKKRTRGWLSFVFKITLPETELLYKYAVLKEVFNLTEEELQVARYITNEHFASKPSLLRRINGETSLEAIILRLKNPKW